MTVETLKRNKDDRADDLQNKAFTKLQQLPIPENDINIKISTETLAILINTQIYLLHCT